MNPYTNSNQLISEKNYISVLLEIILPLNSETTAQRYARVWSFCWCVTALLLVLLVLVLFETAFQ